MSLASRVKERPKTTHCSVAKLFADVEAKGPEELAALRLMMFGRSDLTEARHDARGWNEREVFEAVTKEGFEVAKNQINEHRGKRCGCYRDAR